MEDEKAFELAKKQIKEDIGKELSDCPAYMLKFYNFFGMNIEESFYMPKWKKLKIAGTRIK